MKKPRSKNPIHNNSGFIIVDFIFSLSLVLGCGIVIFALTFSLATIEISQYIVWSTARNYSAANISESEALRQATAKFNNLADQFPLLTGRGAQGTPWFTLNNLLIGDLGGPGGKDSDLISRLGSDKENKDRSGAGERRQPWIGAKADLELKLFSNLKVPFLGPIATDKSKFTFPIRAFILRHPSQEECYEFFQSNKRFTQGIQKLEPQMNSVGSASSYVPMEDNGC